MWHAGGDPGAEKRAKRNENTFADVARRYVEEHAKKHNKSWEQADTLDSALSLFRVGASCRLRPSRAPM